MSSYASRLAGMGAAALLVSTCVLAENVTWNGVVDMIWTQPDDNSWSGLIFNNGDTPTFGGLGLGTVTVVGTVAPGNIAFSGGPYTFTGNTISGSGTWTKTTTAAITISCTNTYSGTIHLTSCKQLIFRGKHSVSPNAKFYLFGNGGSTGIKLLMDDAGTVNLGNEIETDTGDTVANQTGFYEIYVANNGGATTNSTIILGKIDLNLHGQPYQSRLIQSTGANGYRLQVGDVDLSCRCVYTSDQGPQGFQADSAPVTIAGTVRQVTGNSGNTTANTLYLAGTSTDNLVTGTIADAADYDDSSNPFAQPLRVLKNGDGSWTFANTNSYSGTTTIKAGKLIIDNGAKSDCLPDGTNLVITGTGKLHLNKGVREKVGSLFFGSTEKAIGEWGSSASGANNQNDTYLSGEGLLYVGMDLPPLATVLIVR